MPLWRVNRRRLPAICPIVAVSWVVKKNDGRRRYHPNNNNYPLYKVHKTQLDKQGR